MATKFYSLILLIASIWIVHLPIHAQKNKRPNIILIVADDLGYTDLGCYGGDINTPNIDKLAKQGIQFTNFHTSPLCAPTRSMLLTGNDNHVAGMGSMFPVTGTAREGKQGYERHLTDRVVTVAQVLKDGGYHTYMSGKWHLGGKDDQIPYAKGFEQSFALMAGGATHFNNESIFETNPTRYRLNEKIVPFPEASFSTTFYTEKMISFIQQGVKDKPFFAYLAYTAPHWPLQVPENYINKYKGRYDIGYDSLRVIRFSQQKKLGIISADASLPPRNPAIKPWNDLTETEKKIEARKMELYAAMVDNLDVHIGMLIDYLQTSGKLENTLIVFMSDNGAAAEDFYMRQGGEGPYIRAHFNNNFENMGKASSFISYGPQWAQAGAAPFKLHKGYTTEGGITAPMIITGNMVSRKPGKENTFISLLDLAPTFLEVAGLQYPKQLNGVALAPMLGESCLSYLRGRKPTVHGPDYVFGLEHDGNCLLIKGNWKITNISEPFDASAFALYDLAKDRGETTDLSVSNAKKYKEMLNEWELFRKKTGVILKEKGEKGDPH